MSIWTKDYKIEARPAPIRILKQMWRLLAVEWQVF